MKSDRGIQLCSRYAFAPNLYHYCGPEKQSDLLGYIHLGAIDAGLSEILTEFDTLYRYLILIASENKIDDPFDLRVVEAYWIGNPLTMRVKKSAFITHVDDVLQVSKKMTRSDFSQLATSLMSHGVPTHTDHVLSIYIRTGHHAIRHTLDTMDQCRISWGRIVQRILNRDQNVGEHWIVDMRHLEYNDEKLTLGPMRRTSVTNLGLTLKTGDIVSIHWGYVCAILTPTQVHNIQHFTKQALQKVKSNL